MSRTGALAGHGLHSAIIPQPLKQSNQFHGRMRFQIIRTPNRQDPTTAVSSRFITKPGIPRAINMLVNE